MFRKILAITGLFFVNISVAIAAFSFYIAPGLSYDDTTESTDLITFQGLNPRIAMGIAGINLYGVGFGLEVFGNPLQPITIHNITNTDQTLKPDWSYGGSIIPSFNLDDVISIYLRGGVIYTGFPNLNNTRLMGLQMGVGAEALLWGPWSGRIEYIRSNYRHTDGLSNIHTDAGLATLVYRFGYDPSKQGLLCF